MAKVFVSSTCHDLIDVRAELKQVLEEMGFDPKLSEDDLDSAFELSGDVHKTSIEECLENVRTSDCFVLVLSQRYGPPLGKCGYPDVSATHLEYHEAVKRKNRGEKFKMFVYVRDRLEVDFGNWKANRALSGWKPRWVAEKDAPSLFKFLEEVARLESHDGRDGTSNWFTRFRDTTTLKQIVRRHLVGLSPKALVERLVREQRMATVLVGEAINRRPGMPNEYRVPLRKPGEVFFVKFVYRVRNIGSIPAMNATAKATCEFGVRGTTVEVELRGQVLLPHGGEGCELDVLLSGRFPSEIPFQGEYPPTQVAVALTFTLPTGEIICDTSRFKITISKERTIRSTVPEESGTVDAFIYRPSANVEFAGKAFVGFASLIADQQSA
jgi:hypothetical protein